MVVSVRLSREGARLLAKLSKSRGGSKAAVVEEAVRLLAERDSATADEDAGGLAGIEHVVGIVSIGGNLSERTGEKVRASLRKRRRGSSGHDSRRRGTAHRPSRRADAHHHLCTLTWRKLREPMLTTWPCVTEGCHLLGVSKAQTAIITMLEAHRPQISPTEAPADLERIRTLMEKYGDVPMDLADASLVRVAEREGIRRIFTIDRADFSTYRIGRQGRFTILP